MKRTSMNIEGQLLKELNSEARRCNATQTELVKLLLVEGLGRLKASQRGKRTLEIPTFGEGGLCDGIDLAQRGQILDLLNK